MALIVASASITVIYFVTFFAIQSTLQPFGVHASLGGLFMAAWSAVSLSIAALLTWAIVICCCCI